MLRFVLFVFVLGALSRDCASRCPDSGWSSYNGYCYKIIAGYPESAKSWYDADDFCRTFNGTLASIHSTEEANFLLERLKSWQITDYVWIGLNSLTTPDKLWWSDGSAVDYEIWEQPRSSNKCTMMRKTNGASSSASFEYFSQYRLIYPQCVTPSSTVQFDHSTARFRDYKYITVLSRTESFSSPPIVWEWKDQNCGYLQGFMCKRKEGVIVAEPPPVSLYLPSGNCTYGWYKYGPKCYKFFGDAEVSWNDAKKSCESLGVNHFLVSIHSEKEQMFLTSQLAYQKNDAWIGLERSYTSKLEMWPDNSKYNYSNWMPGDGGYYWVTQCAKLRSAIKTAGKWEASMCNAKAGYICQSEPDPSIKKPPIAPSTCTKDGYINFREACYTFVKERTTWQQAQHHCKEDGGNLITVTDAFENAFLYHLLEGINDNIWIGLSDEKGNGNYKWANKWLKLFLRWQPGEPTPSNVPRCVYANNSTREWGTADCEYQFPYICKITDEKPPLFPIKQHEGKCPFPSNSSMDFGGEHCYHLGLNGFKGWSSALFYCMQKDATLASFHSTYETELLWPLIGSDSTLMWIGLYQKEDGRMVWQNGDKVDFTNWAPGIRQEGGCAYINSKDMLWVRQDCTDGYKFAAPLCMAKKT